MKMNKELTASNKNIKLPVNVFKKLLNLDVELQENDITIKGCCKKKWALLKQYVTNEVSENVQRIQKLMIDKNIDEDVGYSNILDILSMKNICIIKNNKILSSTENLPSTSTSNKFQNKKSNNLLKDTLNSKKKRVTSHVPELFVKKSKTTINSQQDKINEISLPPSANIPKLKHCEICQQQIDNSKTLIYNGHPKGAVDEFVALTDPKLLLFTGEENIIHNFDERPHNKITHFSIYDKEGHLCPFDSGLIEKNVLLYFSGYIKPIYEDNPSVLNGIPAKDLGPINEWWISGFDGGKKALLGLSTAYCEYYLMDPSEQYQPLMNTIQEKMYLSKIIIEYLIDNKMQDPSYEDLLNHVQNCTLPENISQFNEETLFRHAQFICDQVTNFDSFGDEDESPLITISCIKSIIELVGVTFNKKQTRQIGIRVVSCDTKKKKRNFTKATTTNLVRTVFENFFPEQIYHKDMDFLNQRVRCNNCKSCLLPNCGKCALCKGKIRNINNGNKIQTCYRRRCENLPTKVESDSENDDFELPPNFSQRSSKKIVHTVKWTSKVVNHILNKNYYKSACIGEDILVNVGDFVILNTEKMNKVLLIAQIINMYEEDSVGKMFHANMFCRGTDTILGETSDKNEIFLLDECDTCPLGSIVGKTYAHFQNSDSSEQLPTTKDVNIFYYQKQYIRKYARFQDIPVNHTSLNYQSCIICDKKSLENSLNTPVLKDGIVFWRNKTYKLGSAVYLLPKTFEFSCSSIVIKNLQVNNNVDENIYSEFYRKKNDALLKEENPEVSEPFQIGCIQEIFKEDEAIKIKVQKLYRPENTHRGIILSQQLDLNLVYWSDEEQVINFDKVIDKCYLSHPNILDISIDEWFKQGPNRFYFTEKYNPKTQEFLPVDETCSFIWKKSKCKSEIEKPCYWPKLKKPLRTMDVFAGCGGLSEGLHQSGVAETKWAIENEKTAAEAFKLNNPNAIVYNEDCNNFLSQAISKILHTESGEPLPSPGEVELLVGGPPCQGFSGMNRFNAGQYSLFKNSLIVSYLSFCDFYRPKYLILENVRNFAVFKKGIVLKLTLRCLLAMGYQCTCGILQAGSYGVPQIRRRLIILAAAPGQILPQFPEPLYVMNKKGRATQLDIVLDGARYTNGLNWLQIGAPYRTITVRDAISDLPVIPNGCQVEEASYNNLPLSHFQKLLRDLDDQILRDHICKKMPPIVAARMSYIPLANGSDWRDLPNIIIKLSDGTYTNKLQYNYDDKKNGKNSQGELRGVCSCVERRICDSSERQFNTLIPWCLPHTANRHNQWAGLYGRLEWDGVFATIVTNPEPMGHQGKVLHPVQHRVVSIRECARSQGFPDKYIFCGNILDKHRQIGNAVPPPMGVAIGREITDAVLVKIKNNFS